MLKTKISKYYKRPENNGLEMPTTTYKIRVYKIWYEDCPEEFYVGSTKKTQLSERMGGHRKDCRKGNMSKLYTLMREKGINNFKHVQIAWANVSGIDEQRQIEQTFIDKLKPTLNTNKAFRSIKDRKAYDIKKNQKYRKEHKEQCIEYSKKYHQENKEHKTNYNKTYRDRLKDVKTCICGSEINYGRNYAKDKHYASKKHQEYGKLLRIKLSGYFGE